MKEKKALYKWKRLWCGAVNGWVICSTNQLLIEQNLNDACRRSSPRFGSDRIDLQAPAPTPAPSSLSLTSSLSASARCALTHQALKWVFEIYKTGLCLQMCLYRDFRVYSGLLSSSGREEGERRERGAQAPDLITDKVC